MAFRHRRTYSQPRKSATPTLTTDEALEAVINLQLAKLADSVCQETTFNAPPINLTEFFVGIQDPEEKFMEDGIMGKYGHSRDQVAKVWLDDQRGVLCARFPFKQAAIDQLKTSIPKGKKAWNPSLKIWEFSVECIDDILTILSQNFDQVVDMTKEQQISNQAYDTRDSLLNLLDEDDKKAILRLLSKKYHPDINPQSNGKMASINAIFEANK